MLEVGAVPHARGQHDDAGLADRRRRRRPQRREQLRGVVAHRADAVGGEQLGEGARHRPAVLDDVADAARRAQVVLEHAERPGLVADQVDAGHVDADAVRRHDAVRRPRERAAARDHATRHDAVLEHRLLGVHVGQERLERPHPLPHTALDDLPLVGGHDAGDDVEGEGTLLAGQAEGDPLVAERPRQQRGPAVQVLRRQRLQRGVQRCARRQRLAVGAEHLVDGTRGIEPVAVEEVAHRAQGSSPT